MSKTNAFIVHNGMKLYKCSDCSGTGEIMIARMCPGGYTECWDPCEFCEGEGYFPEDDYLIMKLEGNV